MPLDRWCSSTTRPSTWMPRSRWASPATTSPASRDCGPSSPTARPTDDADGAMTGLFDEYRLRGVRFRNRLWVAPMCQYSVLKQDGVPTDWHLVHLGSFARGGAGLVIAEATAVTPEGRISPEDTGIWNDAQVDAWRRIVDFIHAQGAVPGIQLAHAGRKASTFSPLGRRPGPAPSPRPRAAGRPSSASAVAFGDYAAPRALDASTRSPAIVDASRPPPGARSTPASSCVELHAAHGYLLHQFLSPLSQPAHRRVRRLAREPRAAAARGRAGRAGRGRRRPCRSSSASRRATGPRAAGTSSRPPPSPAGRSDAGADFFDISIGGIVARPHDPVGPATRCRSPQHVRRVGRASRSSAVGLITTSAQADRIVGTGQADAVMMGRALLRDPHFPLRAAHELGRRARLLAAAVRPGALGHAALTC